MTLETRTRNSTIFLAMEPKLETEALPSAAWRMRERWSDAWGDGEEEDDEYEGREEVGDEDDVERGIREERDRVAYLWPEENFHYEGE